MFVSEYFGLDDELDRIGVFDCVLNNDSRFFINLMRLKKYLMYPNSKVHISE